MEYIPYEGKTIVENGTEYWVGQLNHHIIKQRREELHLNMQDVADAAKITLRQYQRFENGDRDICSTSARIYLSICAILKFEPFTFFTDIVQKQEKKDERKIEFIPAKPCISVPVCFYIAVISKIPFGKLTRWEDIEAFFKKIYNAEVVAPREHMYWSDVDSSGNEVPYWRIVGAKGHIPNSSRAGGKIVQIERLRREGVIAELSNSQTDSYRITNYKDLLFDLNQIDPQEILSLEDTDKHRLTAIGEKVFGTEMIRVLPIGVVRQLADGNLLTDENDVKTKQYIENAKQELLRRSKKENI